MRLKLSGFTLIEILIVILIISIVSGVAVISIGQNESKRVEVLANELSQYLQLASEQALLEPAILGAYIDDRGWSFARYIPGKEGKHFWMKISDPPFDAHIITSKINLSIKLPNQKTGSASPLSRGQAQDGLAMTADGDEEEASPQIIFASNGNLTPFTIYVAQASQAPTYQINGEADGTITVSNIN